MPFTEGVGYTKGSDTSKKAAKSIVLGPSLTEVLSAIKSFPNKGLTCEDVCKLLHKPHESVSPRFAPLRRAKMIVDSGETRMASKGRPQTVWKLAT